MADSRWLGKGRFALAGVERDGTQRRRAFEQAATLNSCQQMKLDENLLITTLIDAPPGRQLAADRPYRDTLAPSCAYFGAPRAPLAAFKRARVP